MTDISAARNRRPDFNQEELVALRRDDSTSAILNKSRRDAGYKEPDVAVLGDSRSLDATMKHHQTHVGVGETVAAAADAIELVDLISGAEKLHKLGRSGCVAIPVVAWVAGQVSMYELHKKKTDTKDAATRDQMHAAMLDKLDIPAGYRDQEIGRLGVSMANHHAAKKIADQFELTDKPLLATLQLHCDQGMHAARDMIESGQPKDVFLKAHPAMAERYARDAAFHDGLDALLWAKKDSPGTYNATLASLTSRDARYDAAHVTYRL